MKTLAAILFLFLYTSISFSQVITIHVFVALCDNENQGIVPVPKNLGDGKDPDRNLYWGAMYGVKSFFKNDTSNWEMLTSKKIVQNVVLERLLFKNKTNDVYLLADAYDGAKIKRCVEDFLRSSNGQLPVEIIHDSTAYGFGGNANLVAYIGHNGLMDFDVDIDYNEGNGGDKDVIILACYSKDYFSLEIIKAKANPILWTTHLMAPEAYTLKSAIDGWIQNESGGEIEERAERTYNKYQNCGINGARNLFTTGF